MRIAALLLTLLGLIAPELALAANINPLSGNAWDLYVFGNGRVVFEILVGVKMLMVPDAGSTGFQALLLLLATVGFVVLAIGAGFDPARNLTRMFTYVLVVWFITFATTKLTANVNINDLVADATVGPGNYTVEGVPALVALPAALTSQVGHYFTTVMETYFSSPTEFKIAGQAAGQFNLFNRMAKESSQYLITSPEIKKSLSAYMADCAVPALARGRISTTIEKANGDSVTYHGLDALVRSPNLAETLSGGKHKAIMTRYYPFPAGENDPFAYVPSSVRRNLNEQFAGSDDSAAIGMGVLVSCEQAYEALFGNGGSQYADAGDIGRNAAILLSKGTDAWAKTGVLVPFETAMTSMVEKLAAGGSPSSAYTTAGGFIKQQTLLNTANGTFRQAAIQTGNSELLQAAQLSQAEASQTSAWVAGFSMFQNMTGYVFTVLQAFIFAITPMIVVALFIPGLGKSIFTNYAQILVWMTLWMPCLALINFIITLFGTDSLSTVVSAEGGLNLANKALITEKSNDLVIAAQFLATMTPLITWGIVKGAMAFTEFISQGVGSSFAMQAGAAAASGNMSIGNTSMGNTSMNKFDTSATSAVGFQATNAFTNAGAVDGKANLGGHQTAMNGQGVTNDMKLSADASKQVAMNDAIQASLKSAWQKSNGSVDEFSKAINSSMTAAERQSFDRVINNTKAFMHAQQTTGASAVELGAGEKDGLGERGGSSHKVEGGMTVGTPGGKGGLLPLGANGGMSATGTLENSKSKDIDFTQRGTVQRQAATSDSVQNTFTDGSTQGTGTGTGRDLSNSTGHRMSEAEALQKAIAQEFATLQTMSENIARTDALSQGFGMSLGMDPAQLGNQQTRINDLLGAHGSEFAQKQAAFGGIADKVNGDAATLASKMAQIEQVAAQPGRGYNPTQYAPGLQNPGAPAMDSNPQAIQAEVDRRMQSTEEQARGQINRASNKVIQSPLTTRGGGGGAFDNSPQARAAKEMLSK